MMLPHTGTARLLTEILRTGTGFIEALGHVPAAHPLANGHRAPAFLGIELGAQAAAALEAFTRNEATGDHTARIGHLARVRDAAFLQPDFPVDTPLKVTARLEGAAGPLAIYRISVSLDGIECVQGVISTHSG